MIGDGTVKRRGIMRASGWLLAIGLLLAGCGSRGPVLGDLAPEDLWERGVAEYNERDWEEAIRYFERFVLVGGADPRVTQARYYVAQAYFEDGQYVTAASEFSRLAGDLGRSDLADDARFGACRAYEELSPPPQRDQEYTRAAVDHCSSLVEYFPDSDFAERAQETVSRMRARLAEKLYGNADWYRRRRAYDSAIIYFDDVVNQYPDTVWAPRALLRLYEIYDTLEYEEEREATRQRLLQEYPESAQAREVGEG